MLTQRIAKWDEQFDAMPLEDRDRILRSFLSLVSFAKRRVGDRDEPFLACQVQLWIREMSRLVRAVSAQPSYFWRDEAPLGSPVKGLPAVYCRECGHTGWLGFMRKQDHAVTDDLRTIYPEYFEHGRNVRYLFVGSEPGSLIQEYLDPETLAISDQKQRSGSKVEGVPVRVWTHNSGGTSQKDMQRCPACETDFALTLVGSQAASLSSVAISHLYQSPYNRDKKLLAFTDSVQDASHRAGFFAARTYRFNLRSAIQAVLEAEPSGIIRLDEFADRLLGYWGQRMDLPRMVAVFVPPDLGDMSEYREFMAVPTQSKPKFWDR